MMPEVRSKLGALLGPVYGEKTSGIVERIEGLLARRSVAPRRAWLDPSDVMLITYGDSIRDGSTPPLQVLRGFLDAHAADLISAVHILPCFPWTSDDGFSVVDYREIDPELGTWEDVQALAGRHEIMLDAVINHVSSQSPWFEGFKAGDPQYRDFFTVVDPATDLSAVTRPRTSPLLTPVETKEGVKHVWTTFSDDQIDLNYANPDVLLEVLDILATYVEHGARFLRLDAIGFLWKKIGTSCMHLEETHRVIKAMRLVLESLAPGTILISETNVPHADNITYFGDGDEAHLVYQFPLPPLTLLALQRGNARLLTEWAASLEPTPPGTTFFNFLASHDGIGVRPLEGILSTDELAEVCALVERNGGRISYRTVAGEQRPYELNINYLDAVSLPGDDDATRVKKFLVAQTILLSMAGLPAIYIHSLLGSRNDYEGLARTGRNRSINREKLERETLERELGTSGHLRQQVFEGFAHLLRVRRGQPTLHPDAAQTVLEIDDRAFCLLRQAEATWLLAAINVSDREVRLSVPRGQLPGDGMTDLIADRPLETGPGALNLTLEPYGAAWLVPA